ncbi:MAG: hypothetical protein AB1500_02920 [Bacillota bacterium]
MLVKYALAWIPMVLIAVLNGALREGWYGKRIGELRAHQVSTVTGLLVFGVYIWGVTRVWPLESVGMALAVGLVWLALTVVFEFLFGHYVAGHSWQRLLRDYNLFAGRLWVLVLLWITAAPYVFYRLQG